MYGNFIRNIRPLRPLDKRRGANEDGVEKNLRKRSARLVMAQGLCNYLLFLCNFQALRDWNS